MAATYEIIIRASDGTEIARTGAFTSLHVVRTVNNVGTCELTFARGVEQRLGIRFSPEQWIEVWRKDFAFGSSFLLGNTAFLVRRIERNLDRTAVVADDAMVLLKRRIVAYYAGDVEADKSGAADDVIKAYVRENLSSLATDTNRILDSLYFAVDGDLSLGSSLSKAAAWGNLLAVCQELALASEIAGIYLAFDVIAPYGGGPPLVFRTYIGARGSDRRIETGSNLILSEEAGTIKGAVLIEDYTDAISAAYAGGQGQGAARYVATALNQEMIGLGPFARVESFSNSSFSAVASDTDDEADALLRDNRPRINFSAEMTNIIGAQIGIEWNFGDYVTAYWQRRQFDCRIDTLDVTVSGANEVVKTILRAEVEL